MADVLLAGAGGAAKGLGDLVDVMSRLKAFRPVLLFSVAAQFGNALFATSIGVSLEHCILSGFISVCVCVCVYV